MQSVMGSNPIQGRFFFKKRKLSWEYTIALSYIRIYMYYMSRLFVQFHSVCACITPARCAVEDFQPLLYNYQYAALSL